jgi:uncharacterized protein YkwD
MSEPTDVLLPTAVPGAPAASNPPERRRARRWRIVAPLVAVVALGLAAAACAPPGSPGSGATGDIVSAVNQDRAASGLPPLAWDSTLAGLAQSHANEIAASGTLWHSDLAGWLASPLMRAYRTLGENLLEAQGINGWQAEDLWMASGPHRANILSGAFNRIGVGVKVDGAGREWFVAEFGAR